MKAVTKIILPLLLSLAGMVLAAPHQSAPRTQCQPLSCSAACEDMAMNCREVRTCIAKVEAAVPPVHEANSFLYW